MCLILWLLFEGRPGSPNTLQPYCTYLLVHSITYEDILVLIYTYLPSTLIEWLCSFSTAACAPPWPSRTPNNAVCVQGAELLGRRGRVTGLEKKNPRPKTCEQKRFQNWPNIGKEWKIPLNSLNSPQRYYILSSYTECYSCRFESSIGVDLESIHRKTKKLTLQNQTHKWLTARTLLYLRIEAAHVLQSCKIMIGPRPPNVKKSKKYN